ncbi:carbamoyltransferase HypF [Nonomuraea soli]|uniref:Carbamoyltransferase n=1 Tax=Nonomuraea soli TaxID=1032476 RepID=A0A7W0HNN2_9ACTN|nr:carbamoyltransferase HypF [Nonomuraea soli]MBA2889989.1 hydrogenase maturation protein HypF [Nonomuraea soli]
MDATWRIEVRGIVQGVGFRPFVHRLAHRAGIRGTVRNAGGHVVIDATGTRPRLEEFVSGLRRGRPEAAKVDEVRVSTVPADDPAGFFIVDSCTAGGTLPQIPPDLATCAGCLRELFDPADRRYRYPFVNCTACGPRATIIEALPYDRERTTMRDFSMCRACAAEYHDPADRRFHAEPIACPRCGPRLSFLGTTGDAALPAAVSVIAEGGVVAVKGLGGFQLVCDATSEDAVTRLRSLKARELKPLAVMVRDLTTACVIAELSDDDLRVLSSPSAPILLAPRHRGILATGVGHGLPDVGVFLPTTPLHHLLLDDLRRPLVVTSANVGGSPMPIEAVVLETDGVLGHDRRILGRYDDSVVRSLGRRATTIRSGRGLAPLPLELPIPTSRPLLAVGAQLKSTFTLADGERAVVGPHIGDLEDAETLEAFQDAVDRAQAVHGVRPELIAHDLHPGYLSTQLAHASGKPRIAVQHHHAHVAAVAAEHGLPGPFLGVAYDGLGLGDDGTFWGGELLLADYVGYRRLARFSHAPMPGGAAAVRRPGRMALGYLVGGETAVRKPSPQRLAADSPSLRRMIEQRVNCPVASSAGRLFDAASALLGLCEVNSFEGEAALRLENAATGHNAEPLAWRLERRDGLWVYDGVATLHDLLAARDDGEPVGRIAAAFHATVAAVTVLMCEHAATETGVSTVCLSGGVFQNRLLAVDVLDRLEAAGFDAYIGERVPVNDAGISFGQAAVAAARSSCA